MAWQIDFVGLRYTLVTLYRHYEVLFFTVDNRFGAIDILKEDKTCDDDYTIEYLRAHCGIFCLNSVAVARYDALIRTKSPTNCDAHLAKSIFQTHSSFFTISPSALLTGESFGSCMIGFPLQSY